jgi:hypothetical protein
MAEGDISGLGFCASKCFDQVLNHAGTILKLFLQCSLSLPTNTRAPSPIIVDEVGELRVSLP